MGHAIVPVAFFTRDNVDMTEAFLEALRREDVSATLFLNGGNEWARAGEDICYASGFDCISAHGWPFYRMWNAGVRWFPHPIRLILNNDILWAPGELRRLVATLDEAPKDVAITYPRIDPDNRGLAGWCFAIRRRAFVDAGDICEEYLTWYGDDELVLNLKRAGYRTMGVESEIWHRVTQTMRHRPGYEQQIFEDMRLFEKRWPTAGIYGGTVGEEIG